jgi:hypothetical protein
LRRLQSGLRLGPDLPGRPVPQQQQRRGRGRVARRWAGRRCAGRRWARWR